MRATKDRVKCTPFYAAAMRIKLSALSSLLLVACGSDPHSATEAAQEAPSLVVEPGDELGTHHIEAQREQSATVTPTTRAPLVLVALTHVDAEDGAHHTAPAARAVAFEIDGRLVPARALDPLLHVGQLTLHAYRFPRPGLMRFVLDHAQLPPDGAPVFVQFGDDFEGRIQLGNLDASGVR